jgi:hypothetical protein
MEVRDYIQAMALLLTRASHFFLPFSLTVMNEGILDVMFGWRTIFMPINR